MNVANINKQSLAQIYYILNGFNEDTKNKIPDSLINTIRENMDYQYNNEEELLEETKELLYAILNKYILSQSQKDKLSEYYKYYDAKIEEIKSKKYQNKDLFNRDKKEINSNTNNISVVIYKENIFIKFFNKLKNILKK